MTEVFRKWGRVVRFENGTTIRVDEAGEAIEANGVFEARPLSWAGIDTAAAIPLASESMEQVARFAGDVLASAQSCRVERLIVSAGVSRQEANGVAWSEETTRVHLSLVHGGLRILIDLGSFDLATIGSAAQALARAGSPRVAPRRLRLAPGVAAALLPRLVGELVMEQRGGGFDGQGQPLETRAVTSGIPPNWYRPSYAMRPQRAWFNLRARPFGSIDPSAPLAVALLAPVTENKVELLCVEDDHVYPTEVDAGRVEAVSRDEPVWYPYAAGSYGIEMML